MIESIQEVNIRTDYTRFLSDFVGNLGARLKYKRLFNHEIKINSPYADASGPIEIDLSSIPFPFITVFVFLTHHVKKIFYLLDQSRAMK